MHSRKTWHYGRGTCMLGCKGVFHGWQMQVIFQLNTVILSLADDRIIWALLVLATQSRIDSICWLQRSSFCWLLVHYVLLRHVFGKKKLHMALDLIRSRRKVTCDHCNECNNSDVVQRMAPHYTKQFLFCLETNSFSLMDPTLRECRTCYCHRHG